MLVIHGDLADLAAAGDIEPLNRPRILWDSFTNGAVITASGSAAGFPVGALSNGLTYERWKADALPAWAAVNDLNDTRANCCVIAGHNLGSLGATVDVQYSRDGGSSWTTIISAAPDADETICFLFPDTRAGMWRIYLDGTDAPAVAVWFIGRAFVMERPLYGGHSPLDLSDETIIRPMRSQGGQFLGRSIERVGNKTRFKFDNLSNRWVRENFRPFVQHARRDPFGIIWRPVPIDHESLSLDFIDRAYSVTHAGDGETPDCGFVWTDKDITPRNSGKRDLMTVDFQVEGLVNG